MDPARLWFGRSSPVRCRNALVLRFGKSVGSCETTGFGILRHRAARNERMNILSELKNRFRAALEPLVADPTEVLEMIRPAQDTRFGDYQANCAMPLGKQLGRPPREIAAQI